MDVRLLRRRIYLDSKKPEAQRRLQFHVYLGRSRRWTESGYEQLRRALDSLGHKLASEETQQRIALAREGQRAPMPPWFVYFIQQGDAGPIKIGFSRDVDSRLIHLQTASPDPLRLLAKLRGGKKHERKLHATFAAHHQRGEWFRPHEDLLSFIRDLA